MLRLRLLGAFSVEVDGKVIHLPRRKVQLLLAYLAIYPQAHPREHLAGLLWGDSTDQQARTSLRQSIAVLRKHIGSNIFLADRELVQLNPDYPVWVDVRQFTNANYEFQISNASNPVRPAVPGISYFQPAVDTHPGELLEGFYDDWILPLREHYRRLYLDALLNRVQELRARSEYDSAIESARRLLAADRANERAYQHLIFCFVALGNRRAALEAYEQCVRALEQDLEVGPSEETKGLYEWIKQTSSGPPSHSSRITNLPIPLTSFIGRQGEMAEVKRVLLGGRRETGDGGRKAEGDEDELAASLSLGRIVAGAANPDSRLVTLTGAGGSGKTRLAIQAATDLIDEFAGGVWWVDLSVLSDPALVPDAVAKALGLEEGAGQPLSVTIADYISSGHILLLLDNCEHLIDACARLSQEWLTTCPNLQILATSREPLGITGEVVWQVPTLSTPAPYWLSAAQLWLSYESVRLFVERARAVKADFAFTDQNAAAIAQICRRLDGIPLALELAAARVNVLTPEQISARLDDRFNLLTQGSRTALPRQQTLRALIDWSYFLLGEDERAFFRRLSVFAAGFTLEAAQGLGPRGLTSPRVLDLLGRLVSKSLVLASPEGGASRYQLPETIREYAGEKLREAGSEWKRAHDDHLRYFLTLAERAENGLDGALIGNWLGRLEQEHDNLREALQWAAASNRGEPGLRLAASLWRFWKVRGHYHEGRAWCDALAALDPHSTTPGTRANALYAAGMLAYYQSDFSRAQQLLESSLELRRGLDDKRGIVRSLAGLGLVLRGQGDPEHATALLEESLVLARELNDRVGIASALRFQGLAAVRKGEPERAVALFEQALPLQRELGDEESLSNLLNNMGIALSFLGEFERAQVLNEESLEIRRRLDDPHGIALSLHSLSYLARQRGDWKQAKELLTESLRLYHRLGTKENTVECLESMGFLECLLGRPARAAQLYAASQALREKLEIPMPPSNQSEHASEVAGVRSRLDAPAFEEAWKRGRLLTLEEAITLALSPADQSSRRGGSRAAPR